jgi:peptidyl-dipeptidase A
MKVLSIAVLMFTVAVSVTGCERRTKEEQLEDFITAHLAKIKPITKQLNLAYWRAATTGESEDYDEVSRLELEIRKIYSNREEFTLLGDLKDSGEVRESRLARQLDKLYNSYLENQIEPELLKRIVELGTKIEKNFSTFRGSVDGEKVTDNQIKETCEQAGRAGGFSRFGRTGEAEKRGGKEGWFR